MQVGLLNTYKKPVSTKGAGAWVASIALTLFYLALYLPGSEVPFLGNLNIPDVLTPIAQKLHLPSKWFLYGGLYSLGMIIGGFFMLKKHGNSKYHLYRTISLVTVQLAFGFSLPLVLNFLGKPEYYLSYMWPLAYDKLFPSTLKDMPVYMAAYFVLGSLIAFPLIAYFKGKRFYCSWICGCGGLAETFGDGWRHLSDKSAKALKVEQVSIYTVLGLVLATTGLMIADAAGAAWDGRMHTVAHEAKVFYTFFIGAVFSGVIGVGLYPLMGTRVWCRFGCPMAAILGLIQKFGRFRITVKKDMCISCGNCSAYCEMGIDVRAYAMQNRDIQRASCVGCGMCSHVCPRGVLKLETKKTTGPGDHIEEWVLDL
jgi:Pyruvate/2-oxoacid:ferredoxin oxidoreductase delta subunit/F0F1-type ATP synthase membrane subunit c/vacuolar-type H+-ATPase subunit K